MSRHDIGVCTGLSAATVNRLTAVLIADRFVVQDGVAPSTGGRPSIVLRYTGAYRVVAAVKVNADGFVGVLVDFDGVIIERIAVDVEFATAEKIAASIRTENQPTHKLRMLVGRLLREAGTRGLPCVAIGISVPYTVTADGRMSGTEDAADWVDFTAEDLIDSSVGIPVFIENDANALAYGELYHGVGRLTKHFAALVLAQGLGAGLVANGALYRGSRSAAGEVGYLLMGESSLRQAYPRGGDLETRIGRETLSAEARRRGMQLPDNAEISVTEIFTLAQSGDAIAAGMAGEVLDNLARTVAAISSVLDPEFIVLGEGLDRHADFLIPALESRLEGRIHHVPTMTTAALESDAVVLGVAELAMRAVSQFAYLAR